MPYSLITPPNNVSPSNDELRTNNEIRKYCALFIASLTLDELPRDAEGNLALKYQGNYHNGSLKRTVVPPISLTLGPNINELKFLWGAFMRLGPFQTKVKQVEHSKLKKFDENLIGQDFIDVKEELSSGFFKSKSVYNEYFNTKSLKEELEKYNYKLNDPEEEFAHYVPAKLKEQVAYYLAQSIKASFFSVEDTVIKFKTDVDPKKFYALGKKKTAQTIWSISEPVAILDLSGTGLEAVDTSQLNMMFQNAKSIKTINLSHNNLCNLVEDLVVVLSKIHQNVTSIILNDAHLCKLDIGLLTLALKKYTEGSTFQRNISLQGNQLHQLGGDGVAKMLSALRPGTKVDLRNNGLETLNHEEKLLISLFISKNKLDVQWEGKNDPALQTEVVQVNAQSAKPKAKTSLNVGGSQSLFAPSLEPTRIENDGIAFSLI
jgi:hypothetical protein